MASPLNVAIVASELPYPLTAGNRIRTWNLVQRLARRHQITFLAHRNAEADEATTALARHGIGTVLVDRVIPPKSGLTFYARLARNLISPLPYSVASHSSAALRNAAQAFAASNRVDLWQVEAVHLYDIVRTVTRERSLIVAHNIESLIWKRYYETEANPLKRWYIGQQQTKIERFERRVLGSGDHVVAVSAEDARLARDWFGTQHLDVVDNGIDRPFFEAIEPDPDPHQILFLGGFDWRPNQDAVSLLLDHVFPQVRAAVPTARLCLVGRRPSEALARRAQALEGVELHGDVPDVRPYLARSGVMVVPLRIGGGSRLKIIEALASGLPVISTRIGAEGLDLVAGRDFIAADTAETMAHELIAFIHGPGPARAMTERARSFVLERYDWDHLADDLERVWIACVSKN